MEQKKILIATANEGKLQEIKFFLQDLPFKFIGLSDLPNRPDEPEEVENTIEENSILKARYYAEKTDFITLADDGGIFLEGLNGWPGSFAARVGISDTGRMNTILERMEGISNRNATFTACLTLYNPYDQSMHLTYGETKGEILETMSVQGRNGFGYDPIFFVPELDKTYAELTIQEKNAVSHRGKALIKMKYFLQNQFGSKHIVVPFGLIIKDNKILMILRNDPHRPDYHNKWEFPGGSVEFGETMEENIIREVKEEAGYSVSVIKMLQHIAVEHQEYPTYKYQVYLVPYVCCIVSGDGVVSNNESLGSRWFELDDVLHHDLVGENAKMYEVLLPELKKIIIAANL